MGDSVAKVCIIPWFVFLPCLSFQKKVEKEEQMKDGKTEKNGRTVDLNPTVLIIKYKWTEFV